MSFIEILKVVFLGIVEGITEWLPVSSTGHMILVDEFINLNVSSDFQKMFLVVIQLGAIMSVVVLFWNKLFPYSKKEKKIDFDIISMWLKIFVACLPAAILGFILDDLLDVLFYNYFTVALMLIFYGALFIVLEKRNRDQEPTVTALQDLSYQTAFFIGLFQVLALVPGTSRSGATIIGALLLGTSRVVAAEFTFYLAIPMMFGASLFKVIKFGFYYTQTEKLTLIIGCIVAFLVSLYAITFLMSYIKKNDFTIFGYYRIVLGIIVLILFQFI